MQQICVFAFAMIAVYMRKNRLPYIMALLPGMFYMYIVASYILNAKIGFNLPWEVTYPLAGVVTAIYAVAIAKSRV